MIIGTRLARMPSPFHFGWITPYAVSGLCAVLRPIAISVVSRVKPKVSVKIM